MPRFQHFLCFTILVATITFFKVASAHVKIKPALPQIEDPLTVKDVESYTIKVVTTFLVELEKECPKTEKFKVFFEKLKAYSKYLCPVSKAKGYKSDMKAKAGSLFEAMSALISVKHRSKEGSVSDLFFFYYVHQTGKTLKKIIRRFMCIISNHQIKKKNQIETNLFLKNKFK